MTTPPIVREYSAENARTGWLRHVSGLAGYPALAWKYRSLLANFFHRQLVGRFRGSFLGALWVLVHPIFLFTVYYLVFGVLFQQSVTTGEDTGTTFAVYLFAGLLAWSAFQEATTDACGVITGNGNLVKKVVFPCELLPLPPTAVALVVYLVGCIVLLIAGLSTGTLHPGPLMLAWPLVLLVQIVLTLGFGLFLANLQVFMRDTSHLYGIVRMGWFFVTPIFWEIELIEKRLGPTATAIFKLNPMCSLLDAHRQVLGIGPGTEPFWSNLAISAVWAAASIVIGYGFFTAGKHKFADLV